MSYQDLYDSPALASGVKKAAIRLLPFLALMYALAFIDRANVGFAKIAYQADTGIGDGEGQHRAVHFDTDQNAAFFGKLG